MSSPSWSTPLINTSVAIHIQENFSQPSLLMPFGIPPYYGAGGAKIQESAAYRGNKLCCTQKLPRIQTTRKIEKPKRLEGRHHKKPHEPTLDIPPPVNRLRFPSLSLEKESGRPCAFICVQCHFSSGDFMCFLRVKVRITNTWFSFYLYPGEPL